MFTLWKVAESEKGRRGLCEGGGNCVKFLKMGWNRNKGRGNKDGKLGEEVGALKRGGLEPLTMIIIQI